jgi:hypothetical protein
MFRHITRSLASCLKPDRTGTRRARRCSLEVAALEGRKLLSVSHAHAFHFGGAHAHVAAIRNPQPFGPNTSMPFAPMTSSGGVFQTLRGSQSPAAVIASPFAVRNPAPFGPYTGMPFAPIKSSGGVYQTMR